MSSVWTGSNDSSWDSTSTYITEYIAAYIQGPYNTHCKSAQIKVGVCIMLS
jgi:hypothetical protein